MNTLLKVCLVAGILMVLGYEAISAGANPTYTGVVLGIILGSCWLWITKVWPDGDA